MPAPYSQTTHTGIGGVQEYTIGFPFLKASYLAVTVNDAPATFTVVDPVLEEGLLTGSVLIATPTIVGGEEILIQRLTEIEVRLVDWESPAALREQEMDLADNQFHHLLQELTDRLEAVIIIVNDQSLPPGGNTGQVLTKASPVDFDVFWADVPGGGSGGGITVIQNVGAGVGVWRDTIGLTASLRSLVAGAGVTIALQGNDEILIESTAAGGGEVNTASNIGLTGVGVWERKVGADLQFRNIAALAGGGLQVDLDPDPDFEIDISIADGGVTTVKIANDAVTFVKMANMSAEHLLGRFSAGTGDPQELQASDLTLATSAVAADRLILFTSLGLLRQISPADVLPPGSVGNPDLATMPPNSFKGNATGAVASPQDVIFTGISTNATPAIGDFVLGWNTSGTWQKLALSTLPSAGAAFSFVNIVPSTGETIVADAAADTATFLGNAQIAVTGSASSDTIQWTLISGSVSNSFLANMGPDSLKGRLSGTGAPNDIVRGSFGPPATPLAGHMVIGYVGDVLTLFDVDDLMGGGGGGITGAANVGVAGVGFFDAINGSILEFRKLNALAGRGLEVVSDTPNREVDIGIVDGGVSNAMLANVPANSLKGRGPGSTGPPVDLISSSLSANGSPQTSDRMVTWETGGGTLVYTTVAQVQSILNISFPQLPSVSAWTILGNPSSGTTDLATFTIPSRPPLTPPFTDQFVLACLSGGDFRKVLLTDLGGSGATAADAKWAEFWSTPLVRDFLNTSVEPTIGLNDGDAWVLPAAVTGVNWTGNGNTVALWSNGWLFRPFAGGMEVLVQRASLHRFKGLRLRYSSDQGVWHPTDYARIDTLYWTGRYSIETPTNFIIAKSLLFSSPGGVTSIPQAHNIAGVQTGNPDSYAKGSCTVGGTTFAVPVNFAGNAIEVRLDATNVTIVSVTTMSSGFQFCIDIEASVTALPVGIGS